MKMSISLTLLLLLPAVSSGADLVKIPAGSIAAFWSESKGASEVSSPPAPITVESFEAQATAVTNADFIRFLKSNPRWRKSRVSPLFANAAYLNHFSGDLQLAKGVRSQAPVTNVSWFAAMAYCDSLGMRLPSTNEWEFMAAASETKADASKDPAFLARILEWYAKPNPGSLPAVKSGYKNIYGLYDLHGLIWEWTEDFNSNFVTGESREDGTLNRNLFCGSGSFSGADKENYAAFMRFAFRSSMTGKGSVWNLGFRCVK